MSVVAQGARSDTKNPGISGGRVARLLSRLSGDHRRCMLCRLAMIAPIAGFAALAAFYISL